MNSLDMPNTLSMYDTLSSGFVFVNLNGNLSSSGQGGRAGKGLTTSNLCSGALVLCPERGILERPIVSSSIAVDTE